MTKAFNLAQLANFVNSNGQLDLSTGSTNAAPEALTLQTANFTVEQVGSKLYVKYNSTAILSVDSTGNLEVLANVTAYGSP